MCRYDDGDFEWFLDSEHADNVSDKEQRCEDCGRTIPTGEPHVRLVAMENPDGEDSDREYIFAVQFPTSEYFDDTAPYARIDEDNIAVWESLGFTVHEEPDPKYVPKIEQHYSCSQCRLAADWLTKVCDQHVVLVTREDLAEHADEYEPAQLGPHFLALNRLCERQWRYRRSDRLVPPAVVQRATGRAVAHAERVGLHP